MKKLETIDGFLSTNELGKALIRHAELMNNSLNSTNSYNYINDMRLNGMRSLCDLYEEYNIKLTKFKEKENENGL